MPACDSGRTDRRTDRQTDGIAVTSPALAMRALRRAVKIIASCKGGTFFETQCIYNTVRQPYEGHAELGS